MALAQVIQLPPQDIGDIALSLRNLADRVECGDFDDAHNLAWSIDCGDGRIEIGLLGRAPEPAMTGYYLFGRAMRKLEDV